MYAYNLKRNVATAKGALRNLNSGVSCASVKHYVQAASSIMGEDSESYDAIKDYIALYNSSPNVTLLISNDDYWFGDLRGDSFDTIVINPDGMLILFNASDSDYGNAESLKLITSTKRYRENIAAAGMKNGVEGILHLLNDTPAIKVIQPDCDEVASITITAIDKEGNIYHPSMSYGKHGNWDFGSPVAMPNTVVIKKPVIEQSTEIKNKEVKMSTIKNTATVVLAANKVSAVNAAKIEAGGIVLNRAIKLIKPKMPFGTASMIDSPVGQVALANVIALVVEQYAGNNEKAKLLSSAVMDAAMLKMVQSFNIGALIDDLISGVDISGFTNGVEPIEGDGVNTLDKYAK